MRLSFVGITPDTPDSQCPAVFVDEDTGEIWFQAETVTDPAELVRRARVISEPVTEYIRFEHATTESNVAAGEQVRWLPRRESSDLLLPGNDCWVFDNQRAQFNYFSGIGDFLAAELSDDPVVVKQCAAAFEAVWDHAVPHGEYQLR